MVRTSQRYVPVALIAIALALLAGRIVHHVTKLDGPVKGKDDLVRWMTPEEGLRLAATTRQPILFDFTADWCQPCHVLDAEVFRNPEIARDINERFVAIRVVDRQQEEGSNKPEVDALQRRYGVRGFPTVVFADGSGSERARMDGFRGRGEFERLMESVR